MLRILAASVLMAGMSLPALAGGEIINEENTTQTVTAKRQVIPIEPGSEAIKEALRGFFSFRGIHMGGVSVTENPSNFFDFGSDFPSEDSAPLEYKVPSEDPFGSVGLFPSVGEGGDPNINDDLNGEGDLVAGGADPNKDDGSVSE